MSDQLQATAGLTIGEALRRATGRAGNDLAVIDVGCRQTYGELSARVNRLANALLERGIGHGDRVLCCVRNRPELVELYFALQKIGAVYAPVNVRLGPAELALCSRLVEPKAMVFEQTSLPLAESLRDEIPAQVFSVEAEAAPRWVTPLDRLACDASSEEPDAAVRDSDLSLILLTSGTTGRPKGVPRTHAAEIAATLFNLVAFPWHMGERILSVMPMYHTMGVRLLLSGVLLSGTSVLQRQWDPEEALDLVEREQISTMFLVPTMYHDLLRAEGFDARKLTSLRSLGAAGMVIRADLFAEIRAAFGPLPFLNVYGCSEVYCLSFSDYLDRKPGTVGRGAPHQELRLVAPGENPELVMTAEEVQPGQLGEIVARATAPDAFAGYWGSAEATALVLRNGWYFTRDLGYRDEDGDLYVVGRTDDMIISGGENVHPLEVESVLALCPGIADVVVAGLPDERWGQVVTAFVVRRDATLTEQLVTDYCRSTTTLAGFKRPRRIYFVDEIPKSPVGKVQRRVLQERYATSSGAPQG